MYIFEERGELEARAATLVRRARDLLGELKESVGAVLLVDSESSQVTLEQPLGLEPRAVRQLSGFLRRERDAVARALLALEYNGQYPLSVRGLGSRTSVVVHALDARGLSIQPLRAFLAVCSKNATTIRSTLRPPERAVDSTDSPARGRRRAQELCGVGDEVAATRPVPASPPA